MNVCLKVAMVRFDELMQVCISKVSYWMEVWSFGVRIEMSSIYFSFRFADRVRVCAACGSS